MVPLGHVRAMSALQPRAEGQAVTLSPPLTAHSTRQRSGDPIPGPRPLPVTVAQMPEEDTPEALAQGLGHTVRALGASVTLLRVRGVPWTCEAGERVELSPHLAEWWGRVGRWVGGGLQSLWQGLWFN